MLFVFVWCLAYKRRQQRTYSSKTHGWIHHWRAEASFSSVGCTHPKRPNIFEFMKMYWLQFFFFLMYFCVMSLAFSAQTQSCLNIQYQTPPFRRCCKELRPFSYTSGPSRVQSEWRERGPPRRGWLGRPASHCGDAVACTTSWRPNVDFWAEIQAYRLSLTLTMKCTEIVIFQLAP